MDRLSSLNDPFKDRYAILSENGDVIKCDLMTWSKAMQEGYRKIRQEELPHGYWLSTVFLGLNHNYDPSGPPEYFETMIFEPGPRWNEFSKKWLEHGSECYCARYASFAEALEGHQAAKDWFAMQEFKDGRIVSGSETDDCTGAAPDREESAPSAGSAQPRFETD